MVVDLLPAGAEFPPVSAFPPSVELLDPWDGPRTYAEDFYSGGEIPPNSAYLSPSHLTPLATTPRDELDLGLDITLLLTPETATVTPVVIDVGGDRELKFQFEAGGEGDVLVLGADEVENVPTFTMTDDTGMEGAESHALHETDFDAPAFEDLYGSLGEEAAPEVRAEAERVEETQPNDVVADLITPEVSLDTANRGHVDWNHPPAFLSGRAASGPGHLKAPETQSDSRSHIIEGNRSISPEVLEISDDSVEVDVGSSVHITETEATIHTPTLQEDYEESDGRAQEDDLDFTDSFTSGNILASSAIPSVDGKSDILPLLHHGSSPFCQICRLRFRMSRGKAYSKSLSLCTWPIKQHSTTFNRALWKTILVSLKMPTLCWNSISLRALLLRTYL